MYHLESQLPMVMMSIHAEVARHRIGSDGPPSWGGTVQPVRAPRRGSRLIGQLGSTLVALGERLERYELAETSL
jgi:hypothetical protein